MSRVCAYRLMICDQCTQVCLEELTTKIVRQLGTTHPRLVRSQEEIATLERDLYAIMERDRQVTLRRMEHL